jgi:hypothetical protein
MNSYEIEELINKIQSSIDILRDETQTDINAIKYEYEGDLDIIRKLVARVRVLEEEVEELQKRGTSK